MLSSMDSVTCGAHNFRHICPNIVVIFSSKMSPVSRAAYRDLSLFSLFMDGTDDVRCIGPIPQGEKFFIGLHA